MDKVAGRLEACGPLNIKSRRVLKGHQGKVLALDWSLDKRHVVSSSQVGGDVIRRRLGRCDDVTCRRLGGRQTPASLPGKHTDMVARAGFEPPAWLFWAGP